MKLVKDTQKMIDANEFGESLREWAFPEDGFGGYTTTELRKGFKKLKNGDKFYDWFLNNAAWDPNGNPLCAKHWNGVYVGWHYEHDGVLLFIENNKIAANFDCKKSHKWNWWHEVDEDYKQPE